MWFMTEKLLEREGASQKGTTSCVSRSRKPQDIVSPSSQSRWLIKNFNNNNNPLFSRLFMCPIRERAALFMIFSLKVRSVLI